MFNYVTVSFPTLKIGLTPDRVYSFTLTSENFAHEVGILKFRDWDVAYDAIRPGTPVSVLLRSPEGSRYFYSYVHYVNPILTAGQRTTEIMLIGASYRMKQASQRIFINVSADQVIKQIAQSYSFAANVQPHPRIWPQIAQAGHTDLEFMTHLAKRSGYNLRIIGTTVVFKPYNFDFGDLRVTAPVFTLRDTYDPKGPSLYTFSLVVGDALDYGTHMKSSIRVSGVDYVTGEPVTAVKSPPTVSLRNNTSPEVFDRFATHTVAPAFDIANYEAMAQEAKNRYPYRAIIEVSGHPEILPSNPIYLDGLGNQYSGYWVPLTVEHQVREESINRLRYTTLMEIGADSLGAASVWTDGIAQSFPDPYRTLWQSPEDVKNISVDSAVLVRG